MPGRWQWALWLGSLPTRRDARNEGSGAPAQARETFMNLVIGPIIAAVVGAVLAGGVSFGLVSSQTAVPATVDAPYVVYGSN